MQADDRAGAADKELADSVLDVIRRRRRDRSKPGQRERDDTARVALLIQGGGMRGVVSAAMACALDDLGFKDSFDDVYGCSAGAMNAAYFVAGETWKDLSIYYDDLASPDFVNFWRRLVGKPILNLGFAFDEVVERRKPLDSESILASALKLHVPISLLHPPRATSVSEFFSKDDLFQTLRASCWMPIATVGTAPWRAHRALDGGVLTPYLEHTARSDGITHFLSLRTRSSTSASRSNRLGNAYVHRRLEGLDAGLGTAYDQAVAEQPEADPVWPAADHQRSRTLAVEPMRGAEVSRHELSPSRLLRAARAAYAVMYAVLEGRSVEDLRSGRFQVVPRLAVVERPANPYVLGPEEEGRSSSPPSGEGGLAVAQDQSPELPASPSGEQEPTTMGDR